MKKLTEYKKNGRTWRVVNRSGDIAIFASDQFYEVIMIQSHNGREIHGKHFPAAEYPPSNEQWGSKGWSFSDEKKARFKLEKLLETNQWPKDLQKP